LIGDLPDEAVAVRTEGAISAVQDGIGAPPGVEIAASQDDLAVDTIGQRSLDAYPICASSIISGTMPYSRAIRAERRRRKLVALIAFVDILNHAVIPLLEGSVAAVIAEAAPG